MLSFECDYNNGAHPKVLEHLTETNSKQSLTYGFDEWSNSAKEKIRQACEDPTADVFLLVGGTQTNTTVIDGLIPQVEGVVCAQSGHIAAHECGAIERSGHKVITLPSHEGKMHATDLQAFMQTFQADESRDHLAQPGMVYLSFPTELGTLYTAKEIEEIEQVCRSYQLKLFIDGARLGYGLAASQGDITLPWLARHCDAFYIGGTKVGALCGEAVVFCAVRCALHQQPLLQHLGSCHRHGTPSETAAARSWLPLLSRFAHQPTVCNHSQRTSPTAQATGRLHPLGTFRPRPHALPVRHQLGNHQRRPTATARDSAKHIRRIKRKGDTITGRRM